MKSTRLGEFRIISDHGRLGDSDGTFFNHRFHEQRKSQPARADDLLPHRKNCKSGHGDSMVGKDLFRQRFVVGKRQPAWIAAGVWLLQQFQITDDVLIEQRLAFEVFQKVKGNVWFVFFAGFCNHREIASETDRHDVVSHRFEGGDDVVLRSPGLLFFFDAVGDRIRRHEFLRNEDDDPELGFGSESHNGIR